MKFEEIIGATPEEINSGAWNPYLGISINNKIFTAEYLRKYMEWAADKAKERAAVIVVDIIQRINNEVLGHGKAIAAIEKAFRKADEILQLCSEAHASLSPENRKRVIILEWPDIMQDGIFSHNYRLLNDTFETSLEFRELLISMTRRNLGDIVTRLDEEEIVKLSRYILSELPELLGGFLHEGIHYNLNVYPGKIHSIYTELMAAERFGPILKNLKPIGKIALAEAY